jgi:hypothetical protein
LAVQWRGSSFGVTDRPSYRRVASRLQGKFDAELIETANKIATPGKGILVGLVYRRG